jgi:long-chain acyl-CoA synthetase
LFLVIDSIAHLPGFSAARFGDRIAFQFDVEAISFAEIAGRAARCARGLAANGIGRGDRVILHLPNGADWIVIYYAIARLGAVVVPANILLSTGEIDYIAENCGAKAIILPVAKLSAITTGGMLVVTPEKSQGALPLAALMVGTAAAPPEVRADELFTIAYTSGTTGKPKGAMLTHGNIVASVAGTATIHVRTAHDRIFSALPFTHVYGNVVMNSALLTGARVTAQRRFDPGEALRVIEEEQITLFEGVPTMYYQMLAHPKIATAGLRSLTRCTVGGQTMPRAKLEIVVERFGCPILELWGMTEVGGPATSHSPYWVPRLGSIGLPFPATQLRIMSLVDPSSEAALGEPGELLVRGPLVMQGYWNNPEATAETIDENGWLATGDIATQDRDGYVFIVDRKKDMILTGGYNVYPAELEQIIAAHPAVNMVAVVGVLDEEKGELAEAYVVLHKGAELDEQRLLVHCRSSLAAYKVPRIIRFVDDLPRTNTGKILRRALREKPPRA